MSSDSRLTGVPFAQIPEWILCELSGNAVKVWGLLARYANSETGKCDPKRSLLAERLSLSTASIDRAISELDAAGALTVERQYKDDGSNRSSQYNLHLVKPGSHHPWGDIPSPVTTQEREERNDKKTPSLNLDTATPKGVTPDPKQPPRPRTFKGRQALAKKQTSSRPPITSSHTVPSTSQPAVSDKLGKIFGASEQ